MKKIFLFTIGMMASLNGRLSGDTKALALFRHHSPSSALVQSKMSASSSSHDSSKSFLSPYSLKNLFGIILGLGGIGYLLKRLYTSYFRSKPSDKQPGPPAAGHDQESREKLEEAARINTARINQKTEEFMEKLEEEIAHIQQAAREELESTREAARAREQERVQELSRHFTAVLDQDESAKQIAERQRAKKDAFTQLFESIKDVGDQNTIKAKVGEWMQTTGGRFPLSSSEIDTMYGEIVQEAKVHSDSTVSKQEVERLKQEVVRREKRGE